MATYADNNFYLKLDSTEVQAFITEVNPSFSNDEVETTAGAGTDWKMRAAGLSDAEFAISLMYDVTSVPTYIQKIAPGATVTLEFGPEGATSGKPRHVQSVVISSVDHTVSVDKSAVVFSISARGAAAPSVNMMAGGVYS